MLLGVAFTFAVSLFLSRTLLKGEASAFTLELPPYRLPRLPDVLRMMWRRSKVFLIEAGTVILACTVVLWFLLSFPQVDPAALAPGPDGAVTSEQVAGAQLRESWGGQLGREGQQPEAGRRWRFLLGAHRPGRRPEGCCCSTELSGGRGRLPEATGYRHRRTMHVPCMPCHNDARRRLGKTVWQT